MSNVWILEAFGGACGSLSIIITETTPKVEKDEVDDLIEDLL